MKYARHHKGPGREHRCNTNCATYRMVQQYQTERQAQEMAYENNRGPKPSLTFKDWLQHYYPSGVCNS